VVNTAAEMNYFSSQQMCGLDDNTSNEYVHSPSWQKQYRKKRKKKLLLFTLEGYRWPISNYSTTTCCQLKLWEEKSA